MMFIRLKIAFFIFCWITSSFILAMDDVNWLCEGNAPCIRVTKPPGGVGEAIVTTSTYRLEIMVHKRKNNLAIARWWSNKNDPTWSVEINWYRLLETKVRVPITSCRNRLFCTVSLLGSSEVSQSESFYTPRHFLVEVNYQGHPAISSAEIVIRKEKGLQNSENRGAAYSQHRGVGSPKKMDYDQGMYDQNFLDRRQYSEENDRRMDAVNEGRHLGVLPKGIFPSLQQNRPHNDPYVSQNNLDYLSLEHAYEDDDDVYESFLHKAGGTGVTFLIIGVLVGSILLIYGCRKFLKSRWWRRRANEGRIRPSSRAQQREAMRKYKEQLKGKPKKRFPYPRSGPAYGKLTSDNSGAYTYIDETETDDDDFSSSTHSKPKVYKVWKGMKTKSLNLARQAEDTIKASTSRALRASRDAATTVYERRGFFARIYYAVRNGLENCFYTTRRWLNPCLEYVEYYCYPCIGIFRACGAAARQCVERVRAPIGYRKVAQLETTNDESTEESSSDDDDDDDDDDETYSVIRPSSGPITIQPSFIQKTKLEQNERIAEEKYQIKANYRRKKEKTAEYDLKPKKPKTQKQKHDQNQEFQLRKPKKRQKNRSSKNCRREKTHKKLRTKHREHNSRFSTESSKTDELKKNYESSKDEYNPGYTTESSRTSSYNLKSRERLHNFTRTRLNSWKTSKANNNRQIKTPHQPSCDKSIQGTEYSTEPSTRCAQHQQQSQNSLHRTNKTGFNLGYTTESSGVYVPHCSGVYHSPYRRCGLHCIQSRNTKSACSDSSDAKKPSEIFSLASGDYLRETLSLCPKAANVKEQQSRKHETLTASSDYSQLPKVLLQTKQGFQRENQQIEALMRQYEKRATAYVIVDETSRRQRQNASRINKIKNAHHIPAKTGSLNIPPTFSTSKSCQRLLYLRSKLDRSDYYHTYAPNLTSQIHKYEDMKEIPKNPIKRQLSSSNENSSSPEISNDVTTQQPKTSESVHTSEIDELISDGSVSFPTSNIDWTTSSDEFSRAEHRINVANFIENKPKFRAPMKQFPIVDRGESDLQTNKSDIGPESTVVCLNDEVHGNNEVSGDSFGQETTRMRNLNETTTNITTENSKNSFQSTRSVANESDCQSTKPLPSARSAADILQSAALAFLTSDDDILSNDEDTYEEMWVNQNV